jgi:hypothetical protein
VPEGPGAFLPTKVGASGSIGGRRRTTSGPSGVLIGAISLPILGTGTSGFSRLSDTNGFCSAFTLVSAGGLLGEPEVDFGISDVDSGAPDVASTGGGVAVGSGLRGGNLIGCTAETAVPGPEGSTATGAARGAAGAAAAFAIGGPSGAVIRQTIGYRQILNPIEAATNTSTKKMAADLGMFSLSTYQAHAVCRPPRTVPIFVSAKK